MRTDITREEESLKGVEEQLQNVNDTIADLQADIASTEERFWDLIPPAFHGVVPDVAVNQFSDKIKEVEDRTRMSLAMHKMILNSLTLKLRQSRIVLRLYGNRRKELQAEIVGYQREGEALLDTVRQKTGGLETENEIKAAINKIGNGTADERELSATQPRQQLQE